MIVVPARPLAAPSIAFARRLFISEGVVQGAPRGSMLSSRASSGHCSGKRTPVLRSTCTRPRTSHRHVMHNTCGLGCCLRFHLPLAWPQRNRAPPLSTHTTPRVSHVNLSGIVAGGENRKGLPSSPPTIWKKGYSPGLSCSRAWRCRASSFLLTAATWVTTSGLLCTPRSGTPLSRLPIGDKGKSDQRRQEESQVSPSSYHRLEAALRNAYASSYRHQGG